MLITRVFEGFEGVSLAMEEGNTSMGWMDWMRGRDTECVTASGGGGT